MTFKTVFKMAALLVGMTLATSARAETVYHTPRSLLAEFFPKPDNVRFQRFAISAGLRERLAHRLGYTPRRDNYVFYIATTVGHLDGYALIDDELGQTEPIPFGVKLSPDGAVERTEVLLYRGPRA